MGCDGGTIPTRDELVKTKKRPEQKDPDSVRSYKWQHCALTQEPLSKPVVACELGRLYNKEAIIEKLLSAKSEGKSEDRIASHIKSLKDIRELQLEPNPAFTGEKAKVGDAYNDRSKAEWICPLTSLEMNGRFPFVFDWSNGKVYSKRAYKMLKDDKALAIAEENLIIMNPEEGSSDEDLMFTKMEGRRARIKAAKKAAKEEKRKLDNGASSSNGDTKKEANGSGPSEPKKAKTSSSKEEKKGKSVQNDPTKSEVYKSLFSSHHTALNKPKGNWVTFDPRYN